MSTANINVIQDNFFEVLYTSGYVFNTDNVNGNYQNYQFGRYDKYFYDTTDTAHRTTACLRFPLSAYIYKKINKATLVQNRISIEDYNSLLPLLFEVATKKLISTSANIELASHNTQGNFISLSDIKRITITDNSKGLGYIYYDITSLIEINAIQEDKSIVLTIGDGQNGTPPGQIICSMSSRESGRGSFLSIDYSDMPSFAPIDLSPNTSLNPRLNNVFKWNFAPNVNWLASDPQSASEFSWRVKPTGGTFGSWTTVTLNNTLNEYTLLADTINLPDVNGVYGTLEWRVRTSTINNPYSSYATQQNNLNQTPPLPPVLLYPVGTVVPLTDKIPFSWRYNSELASSQSRVDIEIEQDGTFLEVLEIFTDKFVYEWVHDQLIHRYRWRARTYNALGDVGEWSVWGIFSTEGKPPPPTITNVTNENRTFFEWGMLQGLNWRLKIIQDNIIFFDSDIQPFDLNYRLPIFLADGRYTAVITSISGLGISSDESIRIFTLDPPNPPISDLTVLQGYPHAIKLHFNNQTGLAYIIRNSEKIGETTDNNYIDYSCRPNVKHSYKVQFIDNNNYSESNIREGWTNFIGTTIAPYDDLSNFIVLDRQLDTQPTKTKTISRDVDFVKFSGREMAIAEFYETKNKMIALAYLIQNDNKETFERLEKLSEKKATVIIRHNQYGTLEGVMQGFQVDYSKFGYSVSFNVEGVVSK